MKHTALKILHYAKDGDNSWSTTSTQLFNAIDTQTNTNIQVKADAFQMQFYLDSELPITTFSFDDKIMVFSKQYGNTDDIIEIDTSSSTVFDSTFVFSGLLNQWQLQVGDDGSNQLTVQGVNVSERLLKTIIPAKYIKSGTYNTAPEIINNLLGLVSDKAAGKQITWDSENPFTTNSRGEAYTTIDFAYLDKPVYQMIADLSQDKYTDDGAYYYYIKSKSDGEYFIWRKRNQNYIAGNILREGTDFKLGKIEYGIWDSINYLIIYCGSDPRGTGIKTYAVDTASMGELGMRAKVITLSSAEALHDIEQSTNTTSFSPNSRFPKSFPYTTAFDGTSISNETTYVQWFRNTVRPIAKADGEKYIQKYKYARYKMAVDCLIGRNDLVLGQVYAIHAPSVGWLESEATMEKLRLIDIKQTFGNDGWNTSLEFEQDWEAVIQ